RDVAVTPLHEREQHEAELTSLLRQPVLEALGPLAVGDALDDRLVDEAAETVGEHVARDAEAVEELVEAAVAEHEVAHHEQRPAVAHHLERAGDRAHLSL